jgi:hypothetical protein
MSNHDSAMVLGVIGFMVGYAVGCITMLLDCIRNEESEVKDDADM